MKLCAHRGPCSWIEAVGRGKETDQDVRDESGDESVDSAREGPGSASHIVFFQYWGFSFSVMFDAIADLLTYYYHEGTSPEYCGNKNRIRKRA